MEALRTYLVNAARRLGSHEPEDIAHDIIVRVIAGHLGTEHTAGYWWQAVRNAIASERNRERRYTALVDLPEPEPDVRATQLIEDLKRIAPKETETLLTYYRLPPRRPSFWRLRAYRARQALRRKLWAG